MANDISHPAHYTRYKTEVIEITKHLPFCLGNIVKYVLRAPFKGKVVDCDKALFYLRVCPHVPLQMPAQEAKNFYDALHNYMRELRRDKELSGVAAIQAEFLYALEWGINCGGDYNCLEYWIRELIKVL